MYASIALVSQQRFYRFALLLPLATPFVAGGLGAVLMLLPRNLFPELASRILFSIAWTGLWSTIPMLVFSLVVYGISKNNKTTRRGARRILWAAPLCISVPTSIVLSAKSFADEGLESGFAGLAVVLIFALAVGYGYVILIEVIRMILRITGRWPPDRSDGRASLDSYRDCHISAGAP